MRDAVANLTALGVQLEDALTAATAVPAWIAGCRGSAGWRSAGPPT